MYLYAKDPYEVKYKFSINKPESTDDSKSFIGYSDDMNDIYKNI